MRVIATAGHVDHGKSTLVRALTGTDPDRLAEEKQRGLTIDLGFAGMTLADGETVAFVDVPGHRRFIGNMLAGLGPAPVVMFVVAADQGWQAQSQEHLDAVDALGLSDGLLVLTRCGLASSEQVVAVRAEALRAMGETSLGSVAVVETDAVSGDGIEDVRVALASLVAGLPPVDSTAPVRLWVDRSFSVRGTGTVVTGTLAAGEISVGDVVEVGPTRATVRSLQVLGSSQTTVGPVSRVALALRGVSRDAVPRGSAVVTPGTGGAVSVVDVRRETGSSWHEASETASVHLGTAAVPARVRPLDDVHARLTLMEPLPIILGDRLIIRDDSASRIHCGATVLDVEPSPFERRGEARQRGEMLVGRRAGELEALVRDRGWVTQAWAARVGAVSSTDLAAGLVDEGVEAPGAFYVSDAQARAWRDALVRLVDSDADDALSDGVPSGVVVGKLGVPEALVPALVEWAGLRSEGGRVLGSRHGQGLGAAEQAVEALRLRLAEVPFAAPESDELADLGLGERELAAAAGRGLLLRLRAEPADVVLLPDAPARAMRVLAGLPQPFTTSEARQALGTTRRVVIPLLEHLDARGWTARDGNTRSVVR